MALLLRIVMAVITYYLYYHIGSAFCTYFCYPLLPIITTATVLLLGIITMSIIGNNGSIIVFYSLG